MQIYSRLWTIYFAHKNDLQYVHTPLEEPFESAFNLGKNFPQLCDFDLKDITVFSEIETNYKPIVKRGLFADFSCNYMMSIIDNYQSQQNPLRHENKINICVHVRRGDTLKKRPGFVSDRSCSADQLQLILDKIYKSISSSAFINIHTDDKDFTLDDLKTYNMNIDVCGPGTPALIAMNDMILSDVLFTSGLSSFSGVAGIYNSNIVVKRNFSGKKSVYNNLFSYNKPTSK